MRQACLDIEFEILRPPDRVTRHWRSDQAAAGMDGNRNWQKRNLSLLQRQQVCAQFPFVIEIAMPDRDTKIVQNAVAKTDQNEGRSIQTIICIIAAINRSDEAMRNPEQKIVLADHLGRWQIDQLRAPKSGFAKSAYFFSFFTLSKVFFPRQMVERVFAPSLLML